MNSKDFKSLESPQCSTSTNNSLKRKCEEDTFLTDRESKLLNEIFPKDILAPLSNNNRYKLLHLLYYIKDQLEQQKIL
jgi:hypothetical protein